MVLRFLVYRDMKDYDLETMIAISKAVHFDGSEKKHKTFLYVVALTKTKRKWYGSDLLWPGQHTDTPWEKN